MFHRIAARALVLVAPVLLMAAGPTFAQQMPNFSVPAMGPNQGPPPPEDTGPYGQSSVSFIDSSVPRNTLRLRLDLGYQMAQPMRADYFLAKGGALFTPGLPKPEPILHSYQELTTYAEWAPLPFFSGFIETPVRWINPQVNNNTYGYGDINFGFKLCTWNSEDFLATIQLRFFDPTAQRPGLGTDHWTFEPAFLLMWRPYDNIILEGDVRYWAPLGGTDFASDVIRYGVGISLGQANPSFWIKPVVEAVGWTVRGGHGLFVVSPDVAYVQSAADTIVNGYVGVRFGWGNVFDCYAGYGHCFTGSTWSRDFVRLEVRWFY
jgi:hypothetical protein